VILDGTLALVRPRILLWQKGLVKVFIALFSTYLGLKRTNRFLFHPRRIEQEKPAQNQGTDPRALLVSRRILNPRPSRVGRAGESESL
jgi:hypothetical protein